MSPPPHVRRRRPLARRAAWLAGLAALAGVAGLAVRRGRPDEHLGATVAGGAPPADWSGAAPLQDRSRERMALRSAHLPPPAWEPQILTRLAGWVPEPLTGPWVVLGRLWAAPLSALGLLLAVASGARLRRDDDVLVASPARGLFGAWFIRRGFTAVTLGHVVVSAKEPTPGLMAHERVHARQCERFGPLMAPLYIGLMAAYGYTRHPLERAARAGARRQP